MTYEVTGRFLATATQKVVAEISAISCNSAMPAEILYASVRDLGVVEVQPLELC